MLFVWGFVACYIHSRVNIFIWFSQTRKVGTGRYYLKLEMDELSPSK